ncbi:hypothetical protein [Roseobacter sp. S98]|uniref:hypothetical protein n=1 Tax=Roseobacter algicola (ex Choi et al. 2025) (nom. illeg.) TaxID=3092138 RepID=UPI0035C6D78B
MNLRNSTGLLAIVTGTGVLCACTMQQDTTVARGLFAGPDTSVHHLFDCTDPAGPATWHVGTTLVCDVTVMSLLREPRNVVYTTRAPVVSEAEGAQADADGDQALPERSSSGAKTIPAKVNE